MTRAPLRERIALIKTAYARTGRLLDAANIRPHIGKLFVAGEIRASVVRHVDREEYAQWFEAAGLTTEAAPWEHQSYFYELLVD